MNKLSVEKASVEGKRVLLRCDLNVPYDENNEISDTGRIDESLKTINFLIKHNAKVIICSHFRRPHGVVDSSMSLVYDGILQYYWRDVRGAEGARLEIV